MNILLSNKRLILKCIFNNEINEVIGHKVWPIDESLISRHHENIEINHFSFCNHITCTLL